VDRKVWGKVFDRETLFALYSLHNKGIIEDIKGAVAEGKESRIFLATNGEQLALKIYRVDAAAFERIWPYIRGDPRFWNVGKNRRAVIYRWVRKEFGNLKRMFNAGVSVPKPYAFSKNVLVMQFLGDGAPAPTLKEAGAQDEELFWRIVEDVGKMYRIARLVHADLSEYNIVLWENRHYFIDAGQAVDLKHPGADSFLERDIKNLTRFFKLDVPLNEVIKLVKGERSGNDS